MAQRGQDSEFQGGGQRGGPRRWTGSGPRPARHIPWPEVPPRDNIDRVPLGASSASMYPGYSPADHIYGEAAAEYGAMIAEARRQGKQIETNTDGVEYVVGQSGLSAKDQIEELRKSREEKAKSAQESFTGNEQVAECEPMEGVEQSDDMEQLFTVDSNPTPLNALQNKNDTASKVKNKANDKAKRRVSFQDEQANESVDAPEEGRKKKKAKVATEEIATNGEPGPLLEEDDISAEVDARLKAKEEKRRLKEEKKRKRESGSSQVDAVEDPIEEPKAEKPTKKKQKKTKAGVDEVEALPESVEVQTDKKDKKKKKRVSSETPAGVEPVATEKPKKKRKEVKESTA